MNEIWKPVPSYPEIMASNLGRIKLPESTAQMPHGGFRKYIPRPVLGTKTKASKNARHQYYGLQTRRYGNLKVHRLVCEAFYGTPENKKAVVIHLDENALNNRADNLKWGTQKENLNSPKFIEYCKSRTGENSPVIKGRKKHG